MSSFEARTQMANMRGAVIDKRKFQALDHLSHRNYAKGVRLNAIHEKAEMGASGGRKILETLKEQEFDVYSHMEATRAYIRRQVRELNLMMRKLRDLHIKYVLMSRKLGQMSHVTNRVAAMESLEKARSMFAKHVATNYGYRSMANRDAVRVPRLVRGQLRRQ